MKSKIAIVTGASGGVGSGISKYLAQEGYIVYLISRSKDKLESLVNNIKEIGGTAIAFPLDISIEKDVEQLINEIIKKHGKIDLLFSSAGILRLGTLEGNLNELKEMINTNLLGFIYMSYYVGNQMKKQKNGYIFGVSSMSGKRAYDSTGHYAATKFGVTGYMEALYKELANSQIKVTTICPSFINTTMTDVFEFPKEDMIEVKDIVETMKYILSLGPNASVKEVCIECTKTIKPSLSTKAKNK